MATRTIVRRVFPKLKSDREAAAFWDTHDSTPYAEDLPEAPMKVADGLRRRVMARARLMKKGEGV